MMMRRFLYWLGSLAVAIGVAAPALAQTKLKFAHVYETSEPYHKWAVWAAGEIKQRTAGRYEMDVFPASQLGKETDINQGLTLGTVDIIYTGQAFAARTYPPLAIGGAPFMFRDFDHWKKYSQSPLLQELMDGYFKKGGNKPLAVTLLRRAPHHRQQGHQQARRHARAQAARARRAAVRDVPQGGGRQRDADRLCRGLSGAAEQDGRRAGEPAAHHRGQEVLRGAERTST